jgi:hypothetical protein
VELQVGGRTVHVGESRKLPLPVQAGESRKLPLPVELQVGGRTVHVEPAGAEAVLLESLTEAPVPPGSGQGDRSLLRSVAAASVREALRISGRQAVRPRDGSSVGREEDARLVNSLETVMDTLHSAASLGDFLDRAAVALVEDVGLDVGRVLLWWDGKWEQKVVKTAPHHAGCEKKPPSGHILNKILEKKKTFWQVPAAAPGESLKGVTGVVAAPILNRGWDVIGACCTENVSRKKERACTPRVLSPNWRRAWSSCWLSAWRPASPASRRKRQRRRSERNACVCSRSWKLAARSS